MASYQTCALAIAQRARAMRACARACVRSCDAMLSPHRCCCLPLVAVEERRSIVVHVLTPVLADTRRVFKRAKVVMLTAEGVEIAKRLARCADAFHQRAADDEKRCGGAFGMRRPQDDDDEHGSTGATRSDIGSHGTSSGGQRPAPNASAMGLDVAAVRRLSDPGQPERSIGSARGCRRVVPLSARAFLTEPAPLPPPMTFNSARPAPAEPAPAQAPSVATNRIGELNA